MFEINPKKHSATTSTTSIPVSIPLSGEFDDTSSQRKVLESEPLAASESKPLPKSWSRRRIIFLLSAAALGLVCLILIITLPIVLLRQHKHQHDHDDDPTDYHHNIPDNPSYHILENKPINVVYNFPDPGLLEYNGTWYAFGTNPRRNAIDTVHIPVATSTNFLNWTRLDNDLLPQVAPWERLENHWAPSVIRRDDGKFVLYYTGEMKSWHGHHCVGAAVSEGTDPLGPYTPEEKPLACPRKHGGAIDPSPFKDVDGKFYVTYKADGNSVGHGGYCNNGIKPIVSVPIMLQELKDDGVTTISDAVQILDIEPSDGPLVEAPDIIRTSEGMYYLFYSTHCFNSFGYNVKYAYSKSLKGPYTRAKRPLLVTGDFGLDAPGGATVSLDGTKMVFHADCGFPKRCMYVSAIDINHSKSLVTLTSLNVTMAG